MSGTTPDVPAPVAAFLRAPTPPAWVRAAAARVSVLLNDHANCEKKAASSALALMFRYPALTPLAQRMSRLAREELRHYEQVCQLMQREGIGYQAVQPSSYAQSLRAACRAPEPARLVDTLIIGALIEARSCERFAHLVPVLPQPIAVLYAGLLRSEARHFQTYLGLARELADDDVGARVETLSLLEAELATRPDQTFAFHSGPPGPPAGADGA